MGSQRQDTRSSGSRCWAHVVVPLGVEVASGEVLGLQVSHLPVGDLDAPGMKAVVKFGGNFQAGAPNSNVRLPPQTGLISGPSTQRQAVPKAER